MTAYDLPVSVRIGGKEYPIRYQWRAILDILDACADPELDDQHRAMAMLQIFYPDWEDIPTEYLNEACKMACEFIDCGQRDDGKPKPKTIDWQQDAALIIPEVNKVAGREIRLDPSIHWWTFFGWFMGIGEGVFANVLHIRQKKAKHKKLEKWEQDFYNANRGIVDLRSRETEEEREAKDNILKWL